MDEHKIEELVNLAMSYMEMMGETEQEEADSFVIDLINDVYGVIADADTPLLKLSYKDSGEDIPEDYTTLQDLVKKGKTSNQKEEDDGERRDFPGIPLQLERDIQDALQHVYDTVGDLAFALEMAEKEKAIAERDAKRFKSKSSDLLEQAKKLYKRNEYQATHIRELNETIDEIFNSATEIELPEGSGEEVDEGEDEDND